MRKENVGRLLLSLLTAFVMVVGVFGAALYTDSLTWDVNESSQQYVAGVQDTKTGEIGDAPISAKELKYNLENIETAVYSTSSDSPPPSGFEKANPLDGFIPKELPEEDELNINPETIEKYKGNLDEKELENIPEEYQIYLAKQGLAPLPDDPGTRAVSIDAGPFAPDLLAYGTKDDPKYEGDPILFQIELSGGNPADYMFRWDFNSDGEYDTDWETNINPSTHRHERTYAYPDDHITYATAQAWDGISMCPMTFYGLVMGEEFDEPDNWWRPTAGYTEMTWAWEFELYGTITVDEFGWFYSTSYGGSPQNVYNFKIWDSSQNVVAELTGGPFPYNNNVWNYVTDSTPATLGPGTYRLSAFTETSGSYAGQMPCVNPPIPQTPDGLVQVGLPFAHFDGDAYPEAAGPPDIPMLDMKYSYIEIGPCVVEDTADVFIWNVGPTIWSATVTPNVDEGSPAQFGGSFSDPGTGDDWFFMWEFGDGTATDWMPVEKYSGGIRVLLMHTIGYIGLPEYEELLDSLTVGLGEWLIRLDHWELLGDGTGTTNMPTLDDLLPYDVVIHGTRYAWNDPALQDALAEDTGNLLADYADAGGNIVQIMDVYSTWRNLISGRWISDGYITINRGGTAWTTMSSGWFDASHPIMADYEPFSGCTVSHHVNQYQANGAYEFIEKTDGRTLGACFDVGDVNNPGNGRIVGLTIMPVLGRAGGDWLTLMSNSIKWASQSSAPVLLTMPIDLPIVEHIYVDDHPDHVTLSDTFQPTLILKDDDHGQSRVLGTPVEWLENFNAGWGRYMDNAPEGWTILDYGDYPYTRFMGPSGAHSPTHLWGTDLDGYYHDNSNNYLQSSAIDLSTAAAAELNFWMYRRLETNYDFLYVEASTDGSSFTRVASYTGSRTIWTEYSVDISDYAGSSTVYIRFTLSSDSVTNYYGIYIDDVSISGYAGIGTALQEDFELGLPGTWTVIDAGSTTDTWTDTNPGGRSPAGGCAGTFMICDSDEAYTGVSMDEQLITPAMDLSTALVVWLNYNHEYRHYVDPWSYVPTIADVDISVDGGASWTNLVRYSSGASGAVKLDISSIAAGESNVKVRFHYMDNGNWGWWWMVDNVVVEYPSSPYTAYSEDFESGDGGYTHSGTHDEWEFGEMVAVNPPDYNDWHRYTYYSSYPGGDGSQAARIYRYPYENLDEWLISPPIDLTAGDFDTISFEYDTFFDTYGESYDDTARVLIRYDGGPWQTLRTYTYPDFGGHESFDILTDANGKTAEVAFHYTCSYRSGYRWYVDNVEISAFPEIRDVFGITQMMSNLVRVHNVEPVAAIPDTFVTVKDETATFLFEDTEIVDPALWEETEEFWYRWGGSDTWLKNYIPGQGLGSDFEPDNGDFSANAIWEWGAPGSNPSSAHSGVNVWGTNLGSSYPNNANARLDTYSIPPVTLPSTTVSLSYWQWYNIENFWDGGNVKISTDGGVSWNILGSYGNPYPSSGVYALGYEPGFTGNRQYWHQITFDLSGYEGETVLFRWHFRSDGSVTRPGWSIDDVYLSNYAPPTGRKNIIPDTEYELGDNGIYTVDLQLIDDDMGWDFSSGYPVDPDGDARISHNIKELEVLNVDPEIAPRSLRAYANVDLRLRVTGTKEHTATMTLRENGVIIASGSVDRDPGKPNIAMIGSVEIDVTTASEYELTVALTPAGGGGNPTWIFDMLFPDGKFKEFKHTFNDEHGWTWVISNSELKHALVGCDIILKASASDPGSDDLAFVYNFGDGSPHGIHVYANMDGSRVEGVSAPGPEIFNAHPDRDPFFDRIPNTEKSPEGNPINVNDIISHVFVGGNYFYYVSLMVLDDDVDEYTAYLPNEQLGSHDGADSDYICIDLR